MLLAIFISLKLKTISVNRMHSLQEYSDVDITGLIAKALDVGASVQWFRPDFFY